MSTDIQRRKEQAEVEKLAKKAHEVEAQIKRGIGSIRKAWVHLASYLHEFHKENYWQVLSYESLEAFLGSPDIDMKRSQFFTLVQMYRELVEVREVQPAELEGLDLSKAQVVLPAIQSGKVSLEKGLDDAKGMSRSDLRIEYGGESEIQDRVECPRCHSRVAPEKLEAG